MAEASSRNAVVTGAAGGMGRAITKALVESGRRVVLADRDPASLRAFAAEMGDNTFPIELDITDAKAVDRLPDLIPDAFKPIDILVNNAGHDIGGRTRFDTGTADDWASIIQTNLIGLMRVTRSLLPDMVRRNAGHIVNISSINAVRIIPDMAAYRGDREKEKDYFDQFKMALDPADIARSIVFALDQPPHVQIAEMMILPVNRY